MESWGYKNLPCMTLLLAGLQNVWGQGGGWVFREREKVLVNIPVQGRRCHIGRNWEPWEVHFTCPLQLQWDKGVPVCNCEEVTLVAKRPIAQIKWDDVDGVCFMVGKQIVTLIKRRQITWYLRFFLALCLTVLWLSSMCVCVCVCVLQIYKA